MSMKPLLLVAALSGTLLLPQPHARAAENLGGKPVPGVCLLSRKAMIGHSRVGQSADARLRQLVTQARARIRQEDAPLQADIRAFRAKASSMTPAARAQQQRSLQQRARTVRAHAAALGRRIMLTRSRIAERILEEARPVVASVYSHHGCGLLLKREMVLGGNLSSDLTSEVVQGLDKKVTTIPFDLAPLPQAGKH